VSLRIAELLEYLDLRIPFAWAESWDAVGLLAGDPEAVVERVFVSLDPSPDALMGAIAAGAQVLLTHHPAFLDPLKRLAPAPGSKGVPYDAVRAGIALVSCHTNLDRAPEGADALPLVLGTPVLAPLERGAQPVTLVITYAPSDATDRIRDAMAAAGAGRIGWYEGCAFTSGGTGTYVALAGADPGAGAWGDRTSADEVRVEMVCPRDRASAVAAAARAAHPYEEPVVVTAEGTLSRGAARMGRLCQAPRDATVGSLAALVGNRLGVRTTVWGDLERPVTRFAIAPGSGRSLVADAIAAGVEALVTGELRYHEARDASDAGLSVIEAGHDATEWPLTRALSIIAAAAPGLGEDGVVSDRVTYPWQTV
jgi:dinuclear metal center YbgI/SA1388 family protein